MKLSEVFAQLAYGELAQMGFINETLDGINPTKYGQMVGHVNLALTALFRRFNLKEGHTIIQLETNRLTYKLNTDEDTIFIEDDETPEFINDIHKIERVYTDSGYEMSLNDESDDYSCFTPSMTSIRIPYDVVARSSDLPPELITNKLKVVYRANHPKIDFIATGFNPARIELELPPSHLEPLLYFIASRINNPIGMTSEFHAGNSYAAKYERACQELEVHNVRIDHSKQNNKLIMNGWV
jgi:hypothetical protein